MRLLVHCPHQPFLEKRANNDFIAGSVVRNEARARHSITALATTKSLAMSMPPVVKGFAMLEITVPINTK